MAVRALRTGRYVPEATRRTQPLLVLLSDAFDKSLLQEIDLTFDGIPIESIDSNRELIKSNNQLMAKILIFCWDLNFEYSFNHFNHILAFISCFLL